MAAIDIPALTRGISGLFTADAEGKRAAEDRAKEQQSQAMVDFLRQSQARDLQQRGRDRRERLVLEKQQAAEKKAQREAAATQLASQNAADEDVILGQLREPFDREDKSHTFVMREARRRLAIQNRVPRAGTKPPKDPAEERKEAILKRAGELSRGEMSGMPVNEIMSRATLEVDQQQSFLENEPKLKGALGHVLRGVGGALSERLSGQEDRVSSEEEPDEDPRQSVVQLVRSLAEQGFSHQAIQDSLKQRGINIPLR